MFVLKANWDFPRSVPLKGNARETSGKDQLSQPNCPGISPTFHGRELCALPVVTYKMIQRYDTRVKCRSHVTTFNDISIQAGNASRRWSTRYCLERPYQPHQAGGQTRHARAGRVSCTFVVAFLSRCSRRAQTVSIAFSFLAAPLSPWSPLLPPASYLGVASPLFGGAWAVSVVFGMV